MRKSKVAEFRSVTGFGIDDVIDTAGSLDIEMSRNEAASFLEEHARTIDDAACRAGNDALNDLLLDLKADRDAE